MATASTTARIHRLASMLSMPTSLGRLLCSAVVTVAVTGCNGGLMRVLVCGGRDYKDWDAVCRTLFAIKPTVIIEGGARGADSLAASWADRADVPRLTFPADWDRHGKAAGPIRNQQMLDEGKPDLVVAFPGGRGTADMVRRAEAAGVKVLLVEDETANRDCGAG